MEIPLRESVFCREVVRGGRGCGEDEDVDVGGALF